MDFTFEDKVRERAYHIWMAAGRENGLADLHWLSAEQEVMGEITIPNAMVVKSKARSAKPAAAKPLAANSAAAKSAAAKPAPAMSVAAAAPSRKPTAPRKKGI